VLLCCCVVVLLCCCVVVLLCCCVAVLFVFKRLVVCFSYDIICHNNHIIINNMAKSTSATASQTPPKIASMPVNSYSMSPKKGVKENLDHKIINVTYPDTTPFVWAFDNFYVAKDFVKHLSNRDGEVTIFGGIEFKLFSNLTMKWVKSSMLGNLLLIICIDMTKNRMEDSFPMQAHLAFVNKFARAIICQNIWQEGGIYVVGVSLNESQVADLTAHFYTNTFDEAREAIVQEAIKAAKEEVESLI
jgi:hypothetical protein